MEKNLSYIFVLTNSQKCLTHEKRMKGVMLSVSQKANLINV